MAKTRRAGATATKPEPKKPEPKKTATRAGKPGVARFRSRYPSYRFGDLQFNNHVAQTSDEGLIAKAKKSPHFGQGLDFWLDTDTVVNDDAGGDGSSSGSAV